LDAVLGLKQASEAPPRTDKTCRMSATPTPVILSAAKNLMAIANGMPVEAA